MENFFFTRNFKDYDQFAHEVKAWDLDFLQLDRGEFNMNLLQVKLGNAFLTSAGFNRRLEQHGSCPAECWTFAILSGCSAPIVWHNKVVSRDSLLVYRPGTEIDAISPPGFDVYTLSYPENHLDELGQLLGLPAVRKLIGNKDVFTGNLPGLNELRVTLGQITQQYRQGTPAPTCSSFSNDLESELPKQILRIMAGAQHVFEKVSSRMRRQAIKRVKDFLDTNPNELITIDHLCTIAEVSERTLQYAFKEYFGLTPKKYLNTFRINGARKQLWNADPSTTRIVDIANFWGFWHIGQFAADYRNLFGELPSDTLRKGLP